MKRLSRPLQFSVRTLNSHWIGYAALDTCAAYFCLLAGLSVMENRLMLHPGRRSPDMGQSEPCRVTDWCPRGEFAGFVVEAEAGRERSQPVGTVLVFHGNAGDAEGRMPLATKFAGAGYRVVLAEYPGFGRRAGKATLAGSLDACKMAFGDIRNQWKEPVFICGESLGAGMAGQVVRGQEDLVAGLMLVTPWDSLADLAQAKLPIVPARKMLRFTFDTREALQAYRGPVVVVAAARDTLIPVRHAERLAQAKAGTVLVKLPRAGHNNWFVSMTDAEWGQAVNAWHRAR
jgi:pimeloyl-ACP methyl ester carboxylesterase